MNADRLLMLFECVADTPDAVDRFRRFILDLAVRGKLVPQNSNDESATQLLKRIATEKTRRENSRELRKSRARDDGSFREPFGIPATWRWVRLDAVGAIVGGGTPPSADGANFAEPGDGVPWLTPTDLGSRTDLYVSRGARDLSEKGLRASSATLMPVGTVLFTSRAPIGYVAIAANTISTNQGFKSVVPYVTDCSRYIATAMNAFATEIDANAPGTTFKEVSAKIVAAIPFPLPPLAEQRRIINKVDELMALCDGLEAARAERETTRDRLAAASLARLNSPDPDPTTLARNARFALDTLPALTARTDQIKLRQTILNLAVRGKLVPQDPSDEPAESWLLRVVRSTRRETCERPQLLFPLPRGWTSRRVVDAFDVAGGIQKTPARAPRSNAFPYLGVANVYRGRLELTNVRQFELGPGELERRRLEPGDILIIEGNGSFSEIGRCAKWNGQIDDCVHQNHVIRCRPFDVMVSDFVLLFLNSPDGADVMQRLAITSSGLFSLSVGKIRQIAIPLPPLAEQRRIVAKVDELMRSATNSRPACPSLMAPAVGCSTRCSRTHWHQSRTSFRSPTN